MSGKPDDIPADVWDSTYGLGAVTPATPHGFRVAVSRAILAEREATEKRVADLLKDPVAVRVNYLRGGIACQPLIDEAVTAEREAQRERDAKVADYYALIAADEGAAVIAAAIRNGGA